MLVWIAAFALTFTGLSQVYRSTFWVDYYTALMAHGPTAIRGHGGVVTLLGLLIVVFHNVWSGPVLVLTAFGWVLMAEGVFCLLAPALSVRTMASAEPTVRQKAIVATGVVVLIVAGVLWAVLLSR